MKSSREACGERRSPKCDGGIVWRKAYAHRLLEAYVASSPSSKSAGAEQRGRATVVGKAGTAAARRLSEACIEMRGRWHARRNRKRMALL